MLKAAFFTEFGLGITGATSAAIQGGDVGEGLLFGVAAGGITGLALGAMGPISSQGSLWGAMAKGAVMGAGTGATSKFAGGKGSLRDVAEGALFGNIQGAAFGSQKWAVNRLNNIPAAASELPPKASEIIGKALIVKPAATIIGGLSGGAVGALMSKGDWRAIAVGSFIGGAVGYSSSGTRLFMGPGMKGFDYTIGWPQTSVTNIDAGVKVTAYGLTIFGRIIQGNWVYNGNEGTISEPTISPLTDDYINNSFWQSKSY